MPDVRCDYCYWSITGFSAQLGVTFSGMGVDLIWKTVICINHHLSITVETGTLVFGYMRPSVMVCNVCWVCVKMCIRLVCIFEKVM